QLAIAFPNVGKRPAPFYPQHHIGVGRAEIEMARQNTVVMRLIDAEYLGDPMQETLLALVHHAVRLGDMEQAVEDIFQHQAVGMAGTAQPRHLPGIGLEAGHVLLGEVEKPRHMARLLWWNLEYLLEG